VGSGVTKGGEEGTSVHGHSILGAPNRQSDVGMLRNIYEMSVDTKIYDLHSFIKITKVGKASSCENY